MRVSFFLACSFGIMSARSYWLAYIDADSRGGHLVTGAVWSALFLVAAVRAVIDHEEGSR